MLDFIDGELLSTLMTIFVIPCIALMTYSLIKFIEAKISKIKSLSDNEDVKFQLGLFENLVKAAVTATSQKFVDDLKKKNDGKLSDSDKDVVFNNTKQKVQIMTTPEMHDALEKAYGDYSTCVDIKIDQIVKEIKEQK